MVVVGDQCKANHRNITSTQLCAWQLGRSVSVLVYTRGVRLYCEHCPLPIGEGELTIARASEQTQGSIDVDDVTTSVHSSRKARGVNALV